MGYSARYHATSLIAVFIALAAGILIGAEFGGDSGVPIVIASPDSENAQRFMDIASKAALKIASNILSKPKRSPRLAVIK